MSYSTISVVEFARQLQNNAIPLCIDVRNEDEFAARRIRNSHNLPLPVIDESRVKKLIADAGLNEQQTIYLICAAGKRSEMAAQKLAGGLDNPVCIVCDGGVGDLPPLLHE